MPLPKSKAVLFLRAELEQMFTTLPLITDMFKLGQKADREIAQKGSNSSATPTFYPRFALRINSASDSRVMLVMTAFKTEKTESLKLYVVTFIQPYLFQR